MKTELFDVAIIGAGPSGLSAGLYAARSGLSVNIFSGIIPGGQLMNTTEVENFPSHKTILGPDLINAMRSQVELYKNVTFRDLNVLKIKPIDNIINIQTEGEVIIYKAKSVIVATGAKALWLGIESENRLKGKGVSACATCDGFFFRNKIVAVVGGGDTALEEAITLSKYASKVYIIHRKSMFKASKVMQEKVLSNEKIEIIWNSQINSIFGQNKVTGIQIVSNNELNEIKLDGVFIAIGHKPDTDFIKDVVMTDSKGYLYNYITASIDKFDKIDQFSPLFPTMTNIDGIFCSGDCTDKWYRQASVASGLGVMAALDVEKWIRR